VTGALLLLVLRLLSPSQAFAAVRQGTSVYLFLAGMMLLAELARWGVEPAVVDRLLPWLRIPAL